MRDQTRLPFEFGANPFSGSRDISYANKIPQTDGVKNRTFLSCVVKTLPLTDVRKTNVLSHVMA